MPTIRDEYASVQIYNVHIDIDGVTNEKIKLYLRFRRRSAINLPEGTYYSAFLECGAYEKEGFYAMYGGFFFLGIFLGFLFLMATVLIIYYKQVSEGYEDAGRFKIMQQVGMSEKEVRRSIGSQIRTVFFLPLAAAAAHIAAAFNMIVRLITIFGLHNDALFAVCCVFTFVAFALIYTLVYLLTSRAYYKIVKA